MFTRKSTCKVNPGKLLFSLFIGASFAISSLMATPVAAQGQMTVENLIGQAVSLSNQEYPEVEKAIQRFRNNDVQGALEFLQTAKERFPRLPPTYVTLAKMHMLQSQNMQAAHNLLEMTVLENPEDPEAYLMLADQAYSANRTTESDALFHMAEPLVEQFDDNAKRKRNFEVRLLAGKAAVAERRQQWDRAHELLTEWREMDPDNGLAHARLGVALFKLEKTKDAFESFTKARELNPDMPHPYVSLGKLFNQAADLETVEETRREKVNRARQAFERAYAEDKSDNTTREYAEWLMQRGELDKAAEVAGALREMTPDSAPAALLDGVVALMQDRKDYAEQAFTRALSLDPGNARANDLLALMLIESDSNSDRERALRYAQINAERFQNNSQANITKAYVLYRLGRASEAQEALQIGARGQLQADSAFLIAVIMAEQGQKDQAREALEQVVNQKAGLFIFRSRAEELLRELNQEAG